MTRTRRRYNLPGYLFWHPWRQHPGWHCRIALQRKRKDEIAGILAGLEDFIEGRCKYFKNDDELEAYLMSL